MSFVSQVCNFIKYSSGSKGVMSLNGYQLKTLAKTNPSLLAVLNPMKQPTLDIAYKAKSNYNIALFNLKDGKKSMLSGALSVQNPANSNMVVKYRLNSKPEGEEILTSNGFIDLGKNIEMDDVQVVLANTSNLLKPMKLKVKVDDAINIAAKSDNPAKLHKMIPQDVQQKLADSKIAGKIEEALDWADKSWDNLRTYASKL